MTLFSYIICNLRARALSVLLPGHPQAITVTSSSGGQMIIGKFVNGRRVDPAGWTADTIPDLPPPDLRG